MKFNKQFKRRIQAARLILGFSRVGRTEGMVLTAAEVLNPFPPGFCVLFFALSCSASSPPPAPTPSTVSASPVCGMLKTAYAVPPEVAALPDYKPGMGWLRKTQTKEDGTVVAVYTLIQPPPNKRVQADKEDPHYRVEMTNSLTGQPYIVKMYIPGDAGFFKGELKTK